MACVTRLFLFPTVIDWERSHGGDAHVGNNSEPAGTFSVLPNPFEYAGIVPGGNQPNSPRAPHMAGLLTDNAGYGSHPKVLLCSLVHCEVRQSNLGALQ